jgi:hypothetical protein
MLTPAVPQLTHDRALFYERAKSLPMETLSRRIGYAGRRRAKKAGIYGEF